MSLEACCINHPHLGRIRGLPSDDNKTIQFRNLKFATIPGRWKDPLLFNQNLGDTEFDARPFGPPCPQTAGAVDIDLGLVGDVHFPHEEPTPSEFECLHLVVTIPVSERAKRPGLPVMVWVHGGGFSIGSNSFPQYNLANFVAASADQGVPVIGVAVNYRLGIFGFLASDDLGLRGNYGLKDQVCAFQWIQSNIGGFGGDPKRITAFGESAGAISLSALLIVNQPLFSRAILMSGEVTLRNVRNRSWQNAHYHRNLQLLGLDTLPLEYQKQELYKMEAEQLVKRLPVFQHWSPSVDGELFSRELDLGILSDGRDTTGKPDWCKEIVIGDMKHDGTVLKARFADDPNALQRVLNAVSILFTPTESEKLLREYSLFGTLAREESKVHLVELITDLRFYLATLKTYDGWIKSGNCKSYRYHFHEPNLTEGNVKGLASHEFDIAVLFRNLDKHMPPGYESLSFEMIKAWASFAHGFGWPKGETGEEILVIGPDKKMNSYKEDEYDRRFRRGRGQLMQELGWKRCFQLGEMLQGCYSAEIER